MLARVAEHLAYDARGLADVLVDDRARDDLEEVRVERRRDRAGEQRLARPGGAVQQHALGRLDADAEEELGVEQRQLDDLRSSGDGDRGFGGRAGRRRGSWRVQGRKRLEG